MNFDAIAELRRVSLHDRQRQWHQADLEAVSWWQQERGVEWHYIAPGKPMQNGFVESFNGRTARRVPQRTPVRNLQEVAPEEWRIDYNTNRSDSSLKGLAEICPRSNPSIKIPVRSEKFPVLWKRIPCFIVRELRSKTAEFIEELDTKIDGETARFAEIPC